MAINFTAMRDEYPIRVVVHYDIMDAFAPVPLEIHEWLLENAPDDYKRVGNRFFFKDETLATMFKLRFG